MTAAFSGTSRKRQLGRASAAYSSLFILIGGSAQAAGLGVGVGAGVGHGGISAGVSAASSGVSASAGHSGVSAGASTSAGSAGVGATASAGQSGSSGVSTGVGASASASGSSGVGVSAGAGASAGASQSTGVGAGLGASASAGAGGASVAGGLSTAGGVSRGVASVGTGIGTTPIGGVTAVDSGYTRDQFDASQVAPTVQTLEPVQTNDFYAVQQLPERNDALFLRGLGTLGPDYRVQCSSWFCRKHLLGNAAPDTTARTRADRHGASRSGTFDAIIVAAEAGNPGAEFMVAEVLAGGHGVPANPRRAAMWYARAAQHGNTLAVSRLNRLRAAVADRQ